MMMNRFRFSQLTSPAIIQAPMAGGSNTPALVAAVANAGGIGSFGFSYNTPDKIAADLQATRRLSPAGIINANFFVFQDVTLPDRGARDSAMRALQELQVAKQLKGDLS